jgi:hypothetical protein
MLNWLGHILGLDNLTGPWYGFWSGAGSDIGEFAMFGALVGLLRKYNCETRSCWRLGRHPLVDTEKGTTHHLCAKHHPTGALTVHHIMRIHNRHLRDERKQSS